VVALSATAVLAAPPADASQGTIIAVQGPDESLDVYCKADASTAWSESAAAGPGTTASAPSAARFQNSAGQQGTIIAAAGPDGSLEAYSNVDGRSGWASSPVAGAGAASASPALVRFDNSAGELGSIVAAEGPDNSLDFDYPVDGQASWTGSTVAGSGAAFGTPAIVRYDNGAGAGTTFSDPAIARTVADDGTQGTAVAVEGPDGTLEL
jgi:hypothetical protein